MTNLDMYKVGFKLELIIVSISGRFWCWNTNSCHSNPRSTGRVRVGQPVHTVVLGGRTAVVPLWCLHQGAHCKLIKLVTENNYIHYIQYLYLCKLFCNLDIGERMICMCNFSLLFVSDIEIWRELWQWQHQEALLEYSRGSQENQTLAH